MFSRVFCLWFAAQIAKEDKKKWYAQIYIWVWTWWGLSYPSKLPAELRTCQRLQYRAERVHCACVFTRLSAHTQRFYVKRLPEMHSFTMALIGVYCLWLVFISFHLVSFVFDVKIGMVIIIFSTVLVHVVFSLSHFETCCNVI